ncbi:CaiB/BaiF CoA transferase family protein [Chloroflexota bacterium]
MGKSALDGVKVASFCWAATGPLAVRYLGQFGASVVKVESHARPDVVRISAPYKDGVVGIDNSTWFANANNSCYSVSLNLKKPRGRDIAWKLIEWADVIGENFSPGTMSKMGLDYESVRERKPDIIYFSTSQLGQSGPYSRFTAWGWHASAMSGFTYLIGEPSMDPVPYPGAYNDYIACRFSAFAIMAALEHKRQTGQGQFIDLSQMESSCHVLATPLLDYFANNRVLERNGNRVEYAVPSGVFPCVGDDRWCAIVVSTEEEWHTLCQAMSKPDWINDPRFSTFLTRKKNETELEKLISEWTVKHSSEEVETLLQGVGVAAHVVENAKDLAEDPQLQHRGYFRQYRHSVIGTHTYRGPSFKMSKTPDVEFAGPALGEHNEYVLKELLGLSDDEIAEALIDGSITTSADLPELKSAG